MFTSHQTTKVCDRVVNLVFKTPFPATSRSPPPCRPAGFIIGKLEPGQNRTVPLECRHVETSWNIARRWVARGGGGVGGVVAARSRTR